MPSTCVVCGIGFNNWQDYQDHRMSHVVKHETKIKPERTTTRTKEQIVGEFEYSHFTWFI